MENHPANTAAKTLPIYWRAVKRYPHLAKVQDAMHFCQQLCNLAALDTITTWEYWCAGAVANGAPWCDDGATYARQDDGDDDDW